jgi:hypothetical protein
MAEVKRVEAKIILQKNDDGHWLVVDAPSGKHAMINIENVFEGGVRETLIQNGRPPSLTSSPIGRITVNQRFDPLYGRSDRY